MRKLREGDAFRILQEPMLTIKSLMFLLNLLEGLYQISKIFPISKGASNHLISQINLLFILVSCTIRSLFLQIKAPTADINIIKTHYILKHYNC